MSTSVPFDIAAQLKALKHERKNQAVHRLPPNAILQRRPLNHAPIADVRSGAKVPKVVYVSRRTPMLAAVKRVKKMLRHMEKRALHPPGATNRLNDVPKAAALANAKLAANPEEVLVKASGRAMEQALRIGEWFRNQEKELLCNVEVRTGSVSVVDDIIEIEPEDGNDEDGADGEREAEAEADTNSRVECGDTTLELLGDVTTTTAEQNIESLPSAGTDPVHDENESALAISSEASQKKATRRRNKRKRPMYDENDLPEARMRWVKTVEVAISLQA